jgi:hypothetical protein
MDRYIPTTNTEVTMHSRLLRRLWAWACWEFANALFLPVMFTVGAALVYWGAIGFIQRGWEMPLSSFSPATLVGFVVGCVLVISGLVLAGAAAYAMFMLCLDWLRLRRFRNPRSRR